MRTKARTALSEALAITTVALTVGALAAGCTHPTGPAGDDFGQVTLGLMLSPTVTVNMVTYKITGNGITPISGSIDVTTATHATSLVSGIPVNTNPYTVVLLADSTDGNTHCNASTTFVIMAGATATANLTLQCRGPGAGFGVVAIDGRLDNCPFITQYTISGLQAQIGTSINIGVKATDLDTADTITYSWTASPATIGTFGDATAANTTFHCVSAGTALLSIAVSDGVCGDMRNPAIPLTCVAGSTGAGGATGGGGAGGAAGGGGAGGSAGGPGNLCPAHELLSGNATQCETCTAANCGLAPDPDGDSGCCALTSATDQVLCEAVVSCFQSPPAGSALSPCTRNGDGLNCFCGNSAAACFATAGAANGPCTPQVIAAAKSSSPTVIQGLFSDPNSPLGRANNLLNCRGSFCKTECGIN